MKKVFKAIAIATAALTVSAAATSVFAEEAKVYMGKQAIPMVNPLQPMTINGKTITYAPLRELLENMGYSVNWSSEDGSIRLQPKVIETHSEFDSQPFPLVAADYDEDTYLYAVSYEQAVLRHKGISKAFDWIVTTPRFYLPQINVHDYNGDGSKDIAISLYVGSGTGLSIYELHIVEVVDGQFVDNVFLPEDYLKQIGDAVSYKVDGSTLKISTEANNIDIDITEWSKQSGIELAYGNIVEFALADDGAITMKALLGITTKKSVDPMYFAELSAEVVYEKGTFNISNIEVVAIP